MTSIRRSGGPLVERVLRPFQQFAATESAGGIVLLASTTIALAWANSPFADAYFRLWEQKLSIGMDDFMLVKSLHHWINDGLMTVFFLLVGLEIKREMFVGELSSVRQAVLPIAAAAGGMLVPALIYVALNAGGPGARGWGIPMATDIAFALGVLALIGPRVPGGLKVFLAALAIADDIGAVLVIALFYTAELSWLSLGAAAGLMVILLACNRAGFRHPAVYGVLGVLLWLAVMGSGVHATIAGVLLAMTIPAQTNIDDVEFVARTESAIADFRDAGGATVLANPRQQEALHALERSIEAIQAPLLKIEHGLHKLVAFIIMPLFAFANAGIRLDAEMFAAISWPVVFGVVAGLVIGKVAGISLASVLAVRTNVAGLPAYTGWSHVFGVSWLGGIGFTMSLFVAGLAFQQGPLLASAKLGILAASLIAGCVGGAILLRLPLRVGAYPQADAAMESAG